MFERFGCQAFFLANQGPLSLYSMGLTSGLCLNSGYLTTQTIPVYEGHSLPYCTRQLDIGGQQITNYLGRQLLSERSLAFSSSSEKFLLSDMMERYCYVAQGEPCFIHISALIYQTLKTSTLLSHSSYVLFVVKQLWPFARPFKRCRFYVALTVMVIFVK